VFRDSVSFMRDCDGAIADEGSRDPVFA